MRLVKFTHSCVRLEHDGGVLVIDPGVWSEAEALEGADAVLLTHEHADHVDPDKLRGLDVPVHAPAGSDMPGIEVIGVRPGDELQLAGLTVTAVGGRHAAIYGDQPDVPNVGWLVGGLYHPGDSLHIPAGPVETLLVPVHASWLKLNEAIDFVRAVAPDRAYGIHDAQVNDRGLSSVNAWLTQESGCAYGYLSPGDHA